MSGFNDRYGFTGNDLNNLNRRWNDKVKLDCEWEDFDSFVYWCSQSGYRKGKQIRKRNQDLPHSPDNSYWYDYQVARREEQEERQRKREESEGDFCTKCTQPRSKVCINGCVAWKEQWVQNWNDHICIKPPEPEQPQKREVFCYEHPDLVREGSV